jgi:hypothetical protein
MEYVSVENQPSISLPDLHRDILSLPDIDLDQDLLNDLLVSDIKPDGDGG